MKINLGQVKAWLTYLVGLGSAAYAAYYTITTQSLSHATPAAIIAAVLLGVERFVSDPSTGSAATWDTTASTVTPPAPPATSTFPSRPS